MWARLVQASGSEAASTHIDCLNRAPRHLPCILRPARVPSWPPASAPMRSVSGDAAARRPAVLGSERGLQPSGFGMPRVAGDAGRACEVRAGARPHSITISCAWLACWKISSSGRNRWQAFLRYRHVLRPSLGTPDLTPSLCLRALPQACAVLPGGADQQRPVQNRRRRAADTHQVSTQAGQIAHAVQAGCAAGLLCPGRIAGQVLFKTSKLCLFAALAATWKWCTRRLAWRRYPS